MEEFPKQRWELPKEEEQDAQIGLLEWELEERNKQHVEEIEGIHTQHGIEPLTGTRRREVLKDELDRILPMIRGEMSEQRGSGESFKSVSLIFIDLDKFKQVNDTRGHLEGDKVLIKVAELLRDVIRGTDMLARYGGDEFAVLLPNTDENSAIIIAEKLRATLDTDVELKGFGVTASIGVCSSDVSTAEDTETFIKHADEASYVAKRAGGNRVEVYK